MGEVKNWFWQLSKLVSSCMTRRPGREANSGFEWRYLSSPTITNQRSLESSRL